MVDRQPDIILLTLDCWRADHFLNGGRQVTLTPNLDRLAAESLTFSQAVCSGGWTLPAMTALFSSTYASRHNGLVNLRYAADRPMLSELLQQGGYKTAGFTTNPACGPWTGFQRGFDTFVDLSPDRRAIARHRRLSRLRGIGYLLRRRLTHRLAPRLGIDSRMPDSYAGADRLTDQFLSWLSNPHPRPIFAWLHYMDTHWPYQQSRRSKQPDAIVESWRDQAAYKQTTNALGRHDPGPDRANRWRHLYGQELAFIDDQIGRLIRHLQKMGRWEKTVLLVTGDHGEAFYEHGDWWHAWNQLFDEGIRVPLLLRLPGLTEGRRVARQVSHVDVAPTLLSLAGLPPPPEMVGRALRPETAEAGDVEQPTYVEMLGYSPAVRYRLAVRSGRFKYIYDIQRPDFKQLYDLTADPEERRNLYHSHQATAAQFDELAQTHMAPLWPHLQDSLPAGAGFMPEADPEVQERLKALGYWS